MSAPRSNRAARERAGRRAETLACWYLRLKGYQILVRRYKSGRGEIDIIACKKSVLAIVEVKQRATLALAQDSLTPTLRRRVTQAADIYFARTPHAQSLSIRFDAIFVIGRWKILHKMDIWRDY